MKNEDGFREFVKFAYKCNKVRYVEEAFEEYPVESQWHKGKIEEYKNSFYQNNKEN